MNKTIWIATVAVLVIAIGGVFLPRGNTVVERIVGAISSPDIQSSYLSVNGLTHEYRRESLTLSTTTVCALKSPAATSTLLYGSMAMTRSATGTAYIMCFVKSPNTGTSTTAVSGEGSTKFATTSIAANALGNLNAFATTTLAAVSADLTLAVTDKTFNPNEYLVGYISGSHIITTARGVCQAEFVVN